MSTLAVVEEILRETALPMSVREIVERAGSRLPSKSKTPDTVVARDLSMDIKKKGETSAFVRTSPGRYTLRELFRSQVPNPMAGQMPGQMGGQMPGQLSGQLSGQMPGQMPGTLPGAMNAGMPGTQVPVSDPTGVLTSAMRADRAAPLAVRTAPSGATRETASTR